MQVSFSPSVLEKLKRIKRKDRKLTKRIQKQLSIFESNPKHLSLRLHKLTGKPRTHDLTQHQIGAGLTVGALGVSLRVSSPRTVLVQGSPNPRSDERGVVVRGKKENAWSISITMNFRMIYRTIDKNIAYFFDIGTHDEVYKK